MVCGSSRPISRSATNRIQTILRSACDASTVLPQCPLADLAAGNRKVAGVGFSYLGPAGRSGHWVPETFVSAMDSSAAVYRTGARHGPSVIPLLADCSRSPPHYLSTPPFPTLALPHLSEQRWTLDDKGGIWWCNLPATTKRYRRRPSLQGGGRGECLARWQHSAMRITTRGNFKFNFTVTGSSTG